MSRISPASLSVCILAILCGLGGAYALRTYLKEKPRPVAPAPDPATIPIASLELPAGRMITRGDIGLVLQRTMGELPPHTIARPEDLIGRVLRTPLKPGDTFQTTSLFPEGSGPYLSGHLKPGLRAVTVPVDSLGMIGGYVRPGVIVDVLFRSTSQVDKQGYEDIPEVTVTLFEGVEVVAVGTDPLSERPATRTPPRVEEQKNPMVNVTLACSPEQSGKLRAVLGHGEIALAMHPDEKVPATTFETKQVQEPEKVQQTRPTPDGKSVGYTLENILGVVPQPKQGKTEIFRGSQRTTNVFDVRKNRSVLRNVLVDASSPRPKTASPTSVAGTTPAFDQNGTPSNPSLIDEKAR